MAATPTGFVLIDKPEGPTSHDVVARVRRVLRTRRVGHGGTLDPMATGVLIVGVGRATRLLGHVSGEHKSYRATVQLGSATTTDDAMGEIVSTAADEVTRADVDTALARFRGPIKQRPSAVSAVKVDGRRAYERVRSGEQVVLAERDVEILDLTVEAYDEQQRRLELSVRCSAGTYVRAIARDLGELLGVGGHLTALRRTASGAVTVDACQPLAKFEECPRLLPVAEVDVFDVLDVNEATARALAYGQRVAAAGLSATGDPQAPPQMAVCEGQAVALVEVGADDVRPRVVLVDPGDLSTAREH